MNTIDTLKALKEQIKKYIEPSDICNTYGGYIFIKDMPSNIAALEDAISSMEKCEAIRELCEDAMLGVNTGVPADEILAILNEPTPIVQDDSCGGDK